MGTNLPSDRFKETQFFKFANSQNIITKSHYLADPLKLKFTTPMITILETWDWRRKRQLSESSTDETRTTCKSSFHNQPLAYDFASWSPLRMKQSQLSFWARHFTHLVSKDLLEAVTKTKPETCIHKTGCSDVSKLCVHGTPTVPPLHFLLKFKLSCCTPMSLLWCSGVPQHTVGEL